MRLAVFGLLILCYSTAGAQQTVDVGKQDVRVTSSMFYSVGGNPVSTTKYVRLVDGTPYFRDEWMAGEVEDAQGTRYQVPQLKIDLVDYSVLFIGAGNIEMQASAAIRRIMLINPADSARLYFLFSDYLPGVRSSEKGWYQQLDSGRAILYKLLVRKINEVRPYNSATYEQSIIGADRYFVLVNGLLQPVKKFKELPEMLGSQIAETKTFIGSQQLSGRKEEDYLKLIRYFNQLGKASQNNP